MRHPNEVKDEGIGRHSNLAFPIRPSHELLPLMLEDRRLENALLAIADRAGNHAVVATDARGEPIEKGAEVLCNAFEFSKKGVPLLCSFGDHFLQHLAS